MSDLYKTKRGQKMSECVQEGRIEGIPGHTRGSSKKKAYNLFQDFLPPFASCFTRSI